MKLNIKTTLFIIAAAVFVACSDGDNARNVQTAAEKAAQRKADSLALKVGVTQTIDCLPAFVAQTDGIFDSLGVDVRLRHYTSRLDYDASLRKRSLQGAFIDVKRIENFTSHGRQGMKVAMTTEMQWQLVANRLSRLRKPQQLVDKIVAMTRFSATDFLCDKMVDSVKVSSDRVYRLQVNDVDLRLKMLLNNEIDAAWLPEPQASVARRKGHNVLMQSGKNNERFAVLAFTDETMADKRRRQQVELFVKAYDIAKEKIKKGGKEYYDALIKKYYNYQLN